MKFAVCDDAESLFADTAVWNALSGGIPMRQTQWLGPWWRHLGGDHTAMIVTARDDDGELIGALPLYRRDGGQTVGVMGDGDTCSDFVGPLCRPDDADAICYRLGQHVGTLATDPVHHWTELDFDGGVEGDRTFERFVAGLQSLDCKTHVTSRMSCWRKIKEPTWADHLRCHGKTQRRRMRRWLERVDATDGLSHCDESTEERFVRLVNDIIDLHQRRWNDVDQEGSFADPRHREFMVETMTAFYRDGRATTGAIAMDGQTIAGQMLIIGDDRVGYAYSTGYDIDHADTEPGQIVLVESLHQMYDDNGRYDAIEMMRGDEQYKGRFTCQSRQQYHLRAFAPEMSSKLRGAAYQTRFTIKQLLRRAAGRELVDVAKL